MQQSVASSIRVVITPDYQITSPVHLFVEEAPPPPAPAQQAAPDVAFERNVISESRESRHEQMLDELTGGADEGGASNSALRFEQMGIPRDHVLLALAMVDSEDKVPGFCENFRTLLDMQFETTAICGALVLTGNNIDQAINMLLNGQ